MDHCTIRDFRPDDQGPVRRLILDGLGEHWGHVDASLNPDLDDIARSYGHGRTIVAQRRGSIVGTGTIVARDESTAEIVRMSVAAAQRRTGLGRSIVDELVMTAKDWAVARVVLETSSAWSGVVAFYVSCGFEITGERDGEFGRDTWFALEL